MKPLKLWPRFVFVAVLLLIVLALAGCSSGPEQTAQPQAPAATQTTIDGAALLAERCSTCHSANKVKSEKLTRNQWDELVTEMVGKGAKLNTDEQKALVDYLSETYGK